MISYGLNLDIIEEKVFGITSFKHIVKIKPLM